MAMIFLFYFVNEVNNDSPAEPERIRTLLREEDMPEVQEENVPAGIYRTLYRVILEEKEKKKC